jgi:hypothetical protein
MFFEWYSMSGFFNSKGALRFLGVLPVSLEFSVPLFNLKLLMSNLCPHQ